MCYSGKIRRTTSASASSLSLKREYIVFASLTLLNLAMSGVVYYESKDPIVHLRGVDLPDVVKGPPGLIMSVLEELFSNVDCLEVFEIFRGHGFGAAKSWIAFRRRREIDWSRSSTDTQCFPYEWSTETVQEHLAFFECATDGMAERTWPNVPVQWATSKRASLVEGTSRADEYISTHTYAMAAHFPSEFEQSSLAYSADVGWSLMGVKAPVNFNGGIRQPEPIRYSGRGR